MSPQENTNNINSGNVSLAPLIPEKSSPGMNRKVWLTISLFAALTVVFGIYVHWEKNIDRANDLRHISFLLADELRQSSDELTRAARTYVETGDPRYEKYYHDILDTLDGKKPRPKTYQQSYWDLTLENAPSSPPESGQAIALLELMRHSGFTDEELRKLAEAKAQFDRSTAVELEAMRLAASTAPDAEANRAKARLMLYGKQYNQINAAVMRPINEVFTLMDRRTHDSVRKAEDLALMFRIMFIATTLAAVFMLWRTYSLLHATLGGSADRVHAQIVRIGQGDFSTAITVAPGMENSVLAGLQGMQNKLHSSEIARKQAEMAIQASEARFRQMFENMSSGAVVCEALDEGKDFLIKDVNAAAERIIGIPREELIGKRLNTVFPALEETGLMAVLGRVFQCGQAELFAPSFYQDGRISGWFENFVYRLDSGELVAMFQDVTARKQADAALLLAKQSAEAADQRKDEFLAMLAHELRNPLVPIHGRPLLPSFQSMILRR